LFFSLILSDEEFYPENLIWLTAHKIYWWNWSSR